jgi:hypothetical protein
MSSPSVSAFSAKTLIALCLLGLASCSDTDVKVPKVFGGSEVPPEVLNEPRVVPVPPPAPEQRVWPLLGDVPSRPRDFTPQPTINAAKAQMENDRDQAEQMQQDYQAAPPVLPMAPQPTAPQP